MKYDYPEAVEQINGLNSVSTLKRWKKLAEEIAGASFEECVIPTSRRSSVKTCLFSKSHIQKFQHVADTKQELGLEKAVLKAFTEEAELPRPIKVRVELLEFLLVDLNKEMNIKINQLIQENKRLTMSLSALEKRVIQLENPPKRKVFGKKK